jgi:hypothetical protein
LIATAITAGVSRVASGLLCLHAIAITPAGSIELVRSSFSIDCGLPCVTVRSTPAIVVSGPAQRSLTLWPTRSRSRLATLYIESSDSIVASAAASIATGWSEPVPGRELHPLKSSAFHGARRVENRRSDGSLPVVFNEAFAASPQSGLTWFCFLFPLIEPDWQISRIRLSEKTHAFAHGRLAVRCGNWTKPYIE